MISLFKKRRNKSETVCNSWQDKTANQIVNTIVKWQRECAIWLQGKSEQLPKKAKLLILLAFAVLVGGYSLYLITDNLFFWKRSASIENSLQNSIYIPKSLSEKSTHTFITEEEYKRIDSFKQYINTLCKSKDKDLFDSIITAHPGLLDSILIIENIYKSQSKK